MEVRGRLVLLFIAMLLILPTAVNAVEMVVPPSFPAFEIIDNEPENEGYYFSASTTQSTLWGWDRPYAYVFDARGNLIWFRTEDHWDKFYPHIAPGRLMLVSREYDMNFYDGAGYLLNAGHGLDTLVANVTAEHLDYRLDQHEIFVDDEDNIYLFWGNTVTEDMSQYIQGGQTSCSVKHRALRKVSPDGETLWEWNSHDYLDQLPYTMNEDTTALLSDGFTHLHLNSFQLLDDGDYLLNSRTSSTTFRIDGVTGDVEWYLGGALNQFDFFTELPPEEAEPLRFSWGHDARLHDGNHVTIYDNGNRHDEKRTYAKEYVLDFDAMTAELIWNYTPEDSTYTGGGGNQQLLANGNRVIGWGGGLAPAGGTELTEDQDLVWQAMVYKFNTPTGSRPTFYRWYKLDEWTNPSAPYLCQAYAPGNQRVTLYANWFGHEAEISSYQVLSGLEPDSLTVQGETETGEWVINSHPTFYPLYHRVVPLDAGGDPVGPPSNLLQTAFVYRDVQIIPFDEDAPTTQDSLHFQLRLTNTHTADLDLVLHSRIRPLDGPWQEPWASEEYTLQASKVSNLERALPLDVGLQPGEYVYECRALVGDSLLFDMAEWPFRLLDGNSVAEDGAAAIPAELTLSAVYPNPFNPSVTVVVDLARASDLTVTAINLQGQRVALLADGRYTAGRHELVFDGSALASGTYFLRASTPGGQSIVRKVTLMR